MTDEAKALVERLRSEHGTLAGLIEAAHKSADRIEALTAENERLREALTQIARLRTDLRGDFSLGSKQSDIARAALEGKQ